MAAFKYSSFFMFLVCTRRRRALVVAPTSHLLLLLLVLLLIQIILSPLTASGKLNSSNDDSSFARVIWVDPSGDGDYKKIHDAIDSVPSYNDQHVLIFIMPGTYREKIIVPKDKPFITMRGVDASNTIITMDDSGGIKDSATFSISASDFVASHLTIQNTFGTKGVGVALCVSGDRVAFYHCRFISYKDTLLDDAGRHYYKDCYIEGATDFICGNAASLFERCHIHSVSKHYGAITAHHRNSESENTGYVFVGCKITGEGKMILGRPWGKAARVVYAETYMSNAVSPEGWHDWGNPSRQRTVFYGEYNCTGPGANRTERVKWSRNLSSEEAALFLSKSMIGGQSWLRPTPIYTYKEKHDGEQNKHSPVTTVKDYTKKKDSSYTTEKGDRGKKYLDEQTEEGNKR